MSLHEAITTFQQLKFRLIPTKNKVPIVSGWQNSELFEYDFSNSTEAGFVLPLEILVIDVDPRNFKDTENSLKKLSHDLGFDLLKQCNFKVKTASAGFHLYFNKNKEISLPNSHKNYAGIEFKSKGRQVIIPNSVLPDGRSYSTTDALTNLLQLRELPQSFYNLFSNYTNVEKKSMGGTGIKDNEVDIRRLEAILSKTPPAVQGTGGDNHTYNVCLIGKDLGISPQVFFPYLCEWNKNNSPPWRESELRAKMYNAYRYGKNPNGCDSVDTIFSDTPEEPKTLSPKEAKKQKEELVSWQDELTITQNGGFHKNLKNTVCFLLNDPILEGKIKFDTFSYSKVWKQKMPWHTENGEKNLTDVDYIKIRYLLNNYGFDVNTNLIYEAAVEVATRNSFHPVRDYFNKLPEWDGIKRVENFFPKYCGTENNAYTREVAKKMFGGIVNRIFKPGCKFDYIPVLKGDQGIGKSMLVRTLAINSDWFTDDLGDITNMKDFIPQTIGKTILEWAEMKFHNKLDIDSTKSFLSTQVGRVRRAYDKEARDYPRQFIIVGTTNKDKFLLDETGNRRFLPIDISGKIDIDSVKQDLEQLYAEAYLYYLMGDTLEIVDKEALEIAEKVRDAHFKNDELEEEIVNWIETIEENGAPEEVVQLIKQQRILVNDIIVHCFKENVLRNKGLSNRIGLILRRIGYRPSTFRHQNRVKSGFLKKIEKST